MTIQDAPFTQQNHPKVPRDLKPGHVFVTLDEEIENYGMEARRYRENPEELEAEFTPTTQAWCKPRSASAARATPTCPLPPSIRIRSGIFPASAVTRS